MWLLYSRGASNDAEVLSLTVAIIDISYVKLWEKQYYDRNIIRKFSLVKYLINIVKVEN